MGRPPIDGHCRRVARGPAALTAVGDGEFGLEVGVLLAQALVLGAQRLDALAQRRFGCALSGRDAVGPSGSTVAQLLDLGA
jgi:hypothetical protein